MYVRCLPFTLDASLHPPVVRMRAKGYTGGKVTQDFIFYFRLHQANEHRIICLDDFHTTVAHRQKFGQEEMIAVREKHKTKKERNR